MTGQAQGRDDAYWIAHLEGLVTSLRNDAIDLEARLSQALEAARVAERMARALNEENNRWAKAVKVAEAKATAVVDAYKNGRLTAKLIYALTSAAEGGKG